MRSRTLAPCTKGTLQIVDAYYDIRHSFNNKVASFAIAGYSGADPLTIQNMPEEQAGAVYGAGDGSYALLNYGNEKQTTTVSLPGASSSVFISRDQRYVFAASQTAHTLTVQDRTLGASYGLNLPNVYRVSINPSGSAALAFVQDSNLVYSVYKLQTNQTDARRMQKIASRKTCLCIACCRCRVTLIGPPRRSSPRMAPQRLCSTADQSAAASRPVSASCRSPGSSSRAVRRYRPALPPL